MLDHGSAQHNFQLAMVPKNVLCLLHSRVITFSYLQLWTSQLSSDLAP